MMIVPFEVNNTELRNKFFPEIVPRAIDIISDDDAPLWGKMTAQQMLEHLVMTFQLSTGKIVVACSTPEKLLPRVKKFLYDDRELPRDFKNPMSNEDTPSMLLADLAKTKVALLEELEEFQQYFTTKPEAIHIHPIFGPLGKEEWHSIHFKHCYHHFKQFGIIKGAGKEIV
jgi:oxepin-CoA hydrolase/3-oxo-5,6-dehydrosuberyl-CoA semialdehyde dehydrogenase